MPAFLFLSYSVSQTYCQMLLCAFFGWCGAGVIAVFNGPVPTESINPKFAATSVAMIQGFGELCGTVIGAIIAGILADMYGRDAAMWLCVGLMCVGTLIAFGFYETVPMVLARRAAKSQHSAVGGQ